MFPDDLRYTSKHEWVRQGAGNTVRIGITDYAAEALGDVVYVSLPQVGEEIALDDACAEVESTKSVSDVLLSGVRRRDRRERAAQQLTRDHQL